MSPKTDQRLKIYKLDIVQYVHVHRRRFFLFVTVANLYGKHRNLIIQPGRINILISIITCKVSVTIQ